MTALNADELGRGYAAYVETGDEAVFEHFSPDFFDNVSGQRGLQIFETVAGWLDESFRDRRAELHAAMGDGDRVMIWFTMHGTHIGNGFPRLAGGPVSNKPITWPQVHIFRIANGLVVEHWAVRDDATMLDQIGT